MPIDGLKVLTERSTHAFWGCSICLPVTPNSAHCTTTASKRKPPAAAFPCLAQVVLQSTNESLSSTRRVQTAGADIQSGGPYKSLLVRVAAQVSCFYARLGFRCDGRG